MPIKRIKQDKNNQNCNCKHRHGKGFGAVYGLGFIGAAIYYVSQATTFWIGVLGVLKALVWPIFIVMKILGM